MKESPLFTHTHDLLLWLLQATRKFPREHRFGLGQRLPALGFAFERAIIAAALDKRYTTDHLIQADIELASLRKALLLCQELELLTPNQYRHVSGMTAEVGRLLGTWRKPQA